VKRKGLPTGIECVYNVSFVIFVSSASPRHYSRHLRANYRISARIPNSQPYPGHTNDVLPVTPASRTKVRRALRWQLCSVYILSSDGVWICNRIY
jgi:hypothetical protein